MTVNGCPLAMEIDTGASVSVASLETLEDIREGEHLLKLEEPTVRLQTYTGEAIKVCGSTVVEVTHNDQTKSLPLVITEGSGPALLGRNWLEALQLDWTNIFRIGSNLSLQQILMDYADIFNKELGELRGVAAKIHVDARARPRFVKARPVPFALRAKFEELDRLMALGVSPPSSQSGQPLSSQSSRAMGG